MRIPSGLLHRSCDSLVCSVFLHAGFFLPFSLFFFGVFFYVSSSSLFLLTSQSFLHLFPQRFVFKHALQYPQQHLDFIGSARSRFVPRWWIRSLNYVGFHIIVLICFCIIVTLFGQHLGRGSVTGHFPSLSAVTPSKFVLMLAAFWENEATNSSRSMSGNFSAASSAINVPLTHTLTSTSFCLFSLAGSMTVRRFF